MQVPARLLSFVLAACAPLALSALPSEDLRIEDAAKDSYTFRVVLENRVTAKARDGQVTLSGTVLDPEAKALAQDTVENLPGVTGVTNDLNLKAHYTERSDAWLAVKIRSRLLVRANVSAATTTVAVADGVATLGGTAANAAQKELTGIYAGEIGGVRSVLNRIAIKDLPTLAERIDDASITTQVKYSLLSHRSTSALSTKVVTTDGVVRITGVAKSEAEISLITKLASDVRGTLSVDNDMTVTPEKSDKS